MAEGQRVIFFTMCDVLPWTTTVYNCLTFGRLLMKIWDLSWSTKDFKYYVNSVQVEYECKKRLFPSDTLEVCLQFAKSCLSYAIFVKLDAIRW